MNRGSTIQLAAEIPPKKGFNEAPIHESGKCQPQLTRKERP